jgi:hypothetical protein
MKKLNVIDLDGDWEVVGFLERQNLAWKSEVYWR